MIRGVTFDLDGTLYDLQRIRAAMLWRNLLRLRALRVGKQVREELRARQFDSGAQLRAEEARIAGERLDLTPEAARGIIDDIYDRSLCTALRGRGDPGVHDVLTALVLRGVAVAVVSDRRVDDKLAALGLDDLPWKARLSADDTGALKPSPLMFLQACKAMGLPPSAVLHVGDREETDGAGARAAGIRAAIVAGPRGLRAALADLLDGEPPTSP